ncbi:Beta-carbonic anhydrase 1 [Caballeronia terrestris]|jgi:carbonic anhydrase|uniref:Beta-carbonic anhydrase 1 n=1 Tax=Caballeronia terrestris TaxID=1226301 RepID=A0A158JV52_9BURK|nr:carbonic anhydrase [Caballeronia terrestris]SAL72824.1 Beta-carbonic anhydrase 1 [Caballeronia terrestris]
MDFLETLASRNAEFAQTGFSADLKMLPSRRTMIVGCVDPRVDPMDVLKLAPGEAAVIRNVGGRVNPALLETMAILRTVSRSAGEDVGAGWNLVVLQHTDCGIAGCYHHAPKLLAKHMGVAEDKLDDLAITDPYKAVALDIASLKANPNLPAAFTVTGLVYYVKTGLVETVVPSAPLRAEAD